MLGRRAPKVGLTPLPADAAPRTDSGVMTRGAREREDAREQSELSGLAELADTPRAEAKTLPPPALVTQVDADRKVVPRDESNAPATSVDRPIWRRRIRSVELLGATTETVVADLRRDPRSEK
jgi:hypothetical protein